uniref:Sushi domain-containing protein n=1 Tax=Chromera velia CCMP2878 TaxID=1169474 RepID=A0A0G4G0K0_9ALVE|eukprot:Cvel_19557.t1-p1 / transcript=Cvel_19557.t1 / gene=Cvel_19557 / organism=Chromera_velia_CCMP2878 / gene_product=hypothetical protein / transcript_product=hypothetical protein / location=Cvel_scaffold1695:16553-36135(+) / protein_length=2420 / sequence_SO=supercontig / SO=protein_coding / is_pseudo=false
MRRPLFLFAVVQSWGVLGKVGDRFWEDIRVASHIVSRFLLTVSPVPSPHMFSLFFLWLQPVNVPVGTKLDPSSEVEGGDAFVEVSGKSGEKSQTEVLLKGESLGPDLTLKWGLYPEDKELRGGDGTGEAASFVEQLETFVDEGGQAETGAGKEEEQVAVVGSQGTTTPPPPEVKSRKKMLKPRPPGGFVELLAQQEPSEGGSDSGSESTRPAVTAEEVPEATFLYTGVKRTGFNHIESWPNEEAVMEEKVRWAQKLGGKTSFARGLLFHMGSSLKMDATMPALVRGDGLQNGFTLYFTIDFSAVSAGKRKQVLFDNGFGFQIVAVPTQTRDLSALRIGFSWNGQETYPTNNDGAFLVESCFGRTTTYIFSGYSVQGQMRLYIFKEAVGGSAVMATSPFKQNSEDVLIGATDESLLRQSRGVWVLGCSHGANDCFNGVVKAMKLVYKSQADQITLIADTITSIDRQIGRTSACGNGVVDEGEDCDPLKDPDGLCSCNCFWRCPEFKDHIKAFERHMEVEGSEGNEMGDWRKVRCAAKHSTGDPTRDDEILVCRKGGKWDEPTLRCMEDCRITYEALEGQAVSGPTHQRFHGTTLTVVCANGLQPAEGITESAQQVACIDGTWTKSGLACYPPCKEYRDLGMGYEIAPKKGAGSLRHGADRNITCSAGYAKSTGTDPQTVLCDNGAWTAQTLDCQLDCPHFEYDQLSYKLKGASAMTLATLVHHGDAVTLACKDGKMPASGRKNEEQVFCRGGLWDVPLLQCFDECPPLSEFPVAPERKDRYQIDFGGRRHGDISTVRCTGGYGREGESVEVRCIVGSYEPVELECLKRCPMFELESRNYVLLGGKETGVLSGATRKIGCAEGYSAVGVLQEEEIVCTDGEWSVQTLRCMPRCKTFKAQANMCDPNSEGECLGRYTLKMTNSKGEVIAGSIPSEIDFGSDLHIECNTAHGFRARNPENGKYQRITCLGDENLQQEEVVQLTAFSTVMLRCERFCDGSEVQPVLNSEAYEVAVKTPGENSFTAQTLGWWSEHQHMDPLTSVMISCAANFSSASLVDQSEEELQSAEGAAAREKAAQEAAADEIVCENGNWTQRTLICAPDCSEASLPMNREGYIKRLVAQGQNKDRPSWSHGSVWRYTCDEGFSPFRLDRTAWHKDGEEGNAEAAPAFYDVQCNDGQFGALELLCMKSCDKLPVPDLVRYKLDPPRAVTEHGTFVKVMCNDQHTAAEGPRTLTGKIDNKEILQCVYGSWEPLTLSCKHDCPPFQFSSEDARRHRYKLVNAPANMTNASMPHGTAAEVRCNDTSHHHHISKSDVGMTVCEDGTWTAFDVLCRQSCHEQTKATSPKDHPALYFPAWGYRLQEAAPRVSDSDPRIPHDPLNPMMVECEDGWTPTSGQEPSPVYCYDGSFSHVWLVCAANCPLNLFPVHKLSNLKVEGYESTGPDKQWLGIPNTHGTDLTVKCAEGSIGVPGTEKCPEFDVQEEGYLYERVSSDVYRERAAIRVSCEDHLSTNALADGTPVLGDSELIECIFGHWMTRKIQCFPRCPAWPFMTPNYEIIPPLSTLQEAYPLGLRHGHSVDVKCSAGFTPAMGSKGKSRTTVTCSHGAMQSIDIECSEMCGPLEKQWGNFNPVAHHVIPVLPDNYIWHFDLEMKHMSQLDVMCNINSGYAAMGGHWNQTERIACIHGKWEIPTIQCGPMCLPLDEDPAIRHFQTNAYKIESDAETDDPDVVQKPLATATVSCKEGFEPTQVVTDDGLLPEKTFYPRKPGEPAKDRLICLNGVWQGATLSCRKTCPEKMIHDWDRFAVFKADFERAPMGEEIWSKEKVEECRFVDKKKKDDGKCPPAVVHGTVRLVKCRDDTVKTKGYNPSSLRDMKLHGYSWYQETTCQDGRWTKITLQCKKKCQPDFTNVLQQKCLNYHATSAHSPCNKALTRPEFAGDAKDAFEEHEEVYGKTREKEMKAIEEAWTSEGGFDHSDLMKKIHASGRYTKCAKRQCEGSGLSGNSPYKIIKTIIKFNPNSIDPVSGARNGDPDVISWARQHGDTHVITCNSEKGYAPVHLQYESFTIDSNFQDVVGTVTCDDGYWTAMPFTCDRGCQGPFDLYDPLRNQWLPLFTQTKLENYIRQVQSEDKAPHKRTQGSWQGPLASQEIVSYLRTHDLLGRAENAPQIIWKTEARRMMGMMAVPWWTLYLLQQGKGQPFHKMMELRRYKKSWQALEHEFSQFMKQNPGNETNPTWAFHRRGQHPQFFQNVNETIPLYKHWAIWGPGCCDPTNCWRGLWGPAERQCSARWWGRGSWVVFERLKNGKREDGREIFFSFCNAGGSWAPSERITSGTYPQDMVQTVGYHPESHYMWKGYTPGPIPEYKTQEDFFFSEPVLPTLVDPRRMAKTPEQVNLKDIRGDDKGFEDNEVVEDAGIVKQSPRDLSYNQ